MYGKKLLFTKYKKSELKKEKDTIRGGLIFGPALFIACIYFRLI